MQTSERDAEATSSKASKAEFAKKYDQAFGLYIKTAESFLHLSRTSAVDDKTKQKWKTNAAKALERAEKIKRFVEKSRGGLVAISEQTLTIPVSEMKLTPIGIDHFSPQEQSYVLKKGSYVNGLFYPLWEDPVVVKGAQSSIFTDPDGQPKLSPEQEKVSPIWRRPQSATSSATMTKRCILPEEIIQHIVTDCSVCASISVCLEHGRRFGTSNSHVIDGRYDIRVLFNGAWRRVLIDDRLPFHPDSGMLMCMSVLPSLADGQSGNASLFPKYMKLMGGYDFPGSLVIVTTFCFVSIYALFSAFAGWIPEHIEIKSSTFEREKTWERLQKGFSAGHCVITLGTGPSTYTQWRDVSFLPSHSYAVTNAYEAEEGRMFTVLDSWVRDNDSVEEPSRALQIPWSDVLNIFDGIYLSWDPMIWKKTLTYHGMWKRNTDDDDESRQAYIEFSNSGTQDEEVWILLTRHVVNTHQTSEFIALRVEVEDQNKELNVSENQRLLLTKTRTRVPKSQRSGVLFISASCDGDAREVGFTLTAYSNPGMDIKWLYNRKTPPFAEKVDGSFTSKTCGGNYTYSTFMANPQYRLTVYPARNPADNSKAKTILTLQTKRDIPVHIAVVWSQGRRVADLTSKDLVGTSGAYNYGQANLSLNITAGEYTIVASAFEPHYTGPFSLKVYSSFPIDLKPIPQEGAGMYSKIVRGSWEGQTAAGGSSFGKYSQNPIFELEIPSTARVIIRLQLLQPSTAVALNLAIYPGSKDGFATSFERQKYLATSGPYDDAIAGVAIQSATLAPGKYYVVPSTYNPGVELMFRMIVYSNVAGFTIQQVERQRTS
ncbi:Calpain-like protease palB/RIM13 [Psilocybe cubensis]|uniref:Calpain-like protease palB/RIM13 n=1 Tax=Psilocybe cubensis TaxID=181762 RepID=A0ACB8H145_PSICU|nr:Calpain-like protease palB/RIM13 [Psilocybe cubensis]KAH9481424.1 Calpain-like protease palB/RIM13 [Psilocybe cubensis]